MGPELLILLGGLTFALLGRGRWASVTEDHGFWYSAAQSLLSGGRAMHEVRLQYGPISIWILEAVCRIFGTRVTTIVVLQFVVGLAGILGVQVFSRRFLSPEEQWLSALILVPLIVWMVGPGNLLYPCAFAMSHGLLLLVITLLFHSSRWGSRYSGASAISGALCAVTFLTKQEFGTAAVAGIVALTIFDSRNSWRRKLVTLCIAGASAVAFYFGILELARGGDTLRHLVFSNVLWPWAPIPDSWSQLYRRSQGLDHPWWLIRSAGDTLLIAGVFGASVWLLVYGTSIPRRRIPIFVSALLAGWALWAWRWTEGSHFVPLTLCLPLLMASVILAISRARRGDPVMQELGAIFAVIAGALLLLSREGFRGGLEGYYSGMGYVLAVPASVPVLVAAARGPSAAGRRRWIGAALCLILLGRAGADRLAGLRSHWSSVVPFTTARGTVYSDRSSTDCLKEEASFIDSRTRAGDPILMIPATAGLDFLLDRQNMSFFPNVVPGFVVGEDGERELIERWRAHPPRLVIEIEGVLGVFRRGDFGRTWGRSAQEWIERNYRSLRPLDACGKARIWELAPRNRS